MPTWDELFTREEFRWRDAHQAVVEFVPELRTAGARRVLDLGCGTGRHTVYLANQGFDVWACDISTRGLAHTRQWLTTEGLTAHLQSSDMTALPYRDGAFDGLVSIFVIYHGPLSDVQRTVAEIHRVLRPGSLALLTLISTRAGSYRRGQEVEPDTFIRKSGDDTGVLHHYFNAVGTRRLLSDFEILAFRLEESDTTDEDGSIHHHAHWRVQVCRPGFDPP
jgi:tellurite methyltransferase